MSKRLRCRGFTFVELLFIVAFIMILAVITMPVLAIARENGRTGSCPGLLKQTQMALRMYTEDYDQVAPTEQTKRQVLVAYQPSLGPMINSVNRLHEMIASSSISQAGVVPNQFIAKMYSEDLGRAADPGGWNGAVNYFAANGCSVATLKTWGRSVYLSTEYSNLGYDNGAKVLTLYRGILNREPDSGGFNGWVNQLNSGLPWSSAVDAFFNSTEFANLQPAICTTGSYSFGSAPVISIPTSGGGFQGGTGGALQSILDSTPSGGTAWLAQKAVVRLTTPLVIPAGVTLATTGQPNHYHYAQMGRLVRDSSFGDAAVKLMSGARLQNVWVDGARGRLGFSQPGINILILGGNGTSVTDSLISNTAGWSSFQTIGSAEGWPCASNTIARNLITVYSSSHTGGTWADGLSVACENALVESNEIIDGTDVGIVLFRSTPAVQRSTIRYNRIVAAGNSAYGCLVVDGLYSTGNVHDFNGSQIHNNDFWTGTGTHFDIGISVGTRAWFGTTSDMGRGASVHSNVTPTAFRTRVNTGIAVSGMWDSYVQANNMFITVVPVSACPRVNVGASVSAGYASGSIQPYTDVLIQGCIGH